MSIRYKFRSSVSFDTVEIGHRVSICIGELRRRILGGVSQQQQQGFDLVFSDAVSGLEYNGDDSQIPSGSSVIVKRVPGGTVPSAVDELENSNEGLEVIVGVDQSAGRWLPLEAAKQVGMTDSHNLFDVNGPMDGFDVSGADFCPMPDSNFPDFNQEFDHNDFMGNKKDEAVVLRLECKNLDSSEPDNAIPRGSNQHENEGIILPRVDEHLKLKKLPKSNFLNVQSTNLPLELKCSLCNNFFKDAVMIPCCQHSFCEKCIRQVLMEKGMCPKCFSSKCSAGDLLPNLSLRQAILHFLESQMFDGDLENMQNDVPDGESGIQAKDVSCALTVVQRELELPQSSCATGKGSNQISMEVFHEQQRWRNVAYGNSGNRDLNSGLQSQKSNKLDGVRGMHPHHNDMLRETEDFVQSADFQGENQPVLPQAKVHDEADSSIKRKGGYWIDSGGGKRNFLAPGGYRKGVRNCYTCGSPEHLMRDCPISHPNPMFQPGNGAFHGGMPGFAPPYWSGPSVPPFTPYANMYSNPTMIPFNASMVPVSPFVVPPYIPSMHGSLPGPCVNMRMGNMGPPPSEHFGFQQSGNKRKHSSETLVREQLSDKDVSSDCSRHESREKSQEDEEACSSHSYDGLAQRLGRKGQHEKHMYSNMRYADERLEKSYRSSLSGRGERTYHGERSNLGKDACRSPDWHGEGRHNRHHKESKKCDERREHYVRDSSLGRRSSQRDVKRRDETVAQGSHKNHHRLAWSGFEPRTPAERRGVHEEGDVKQLREQRRDEWQMVSCSDNKCRDEYHHKRRAH